MTRQLPLLGGGFVHLFQILAPLGDAQGKRCWLGLSDNERKEDTKPEASPTSAFRPALRKAQPTRG